jgi:hypothetical protein
LDHSLREVWDVRSSTERYLRLPSEREANLTSAAYAAKRVDQKSLRRLRRMRRYQHLVDGEATPLESDPLSLTVAALRDAGDKFLPHFSHDDRTRRLASLEKSARDWSPDGLEVLRDDEPDDLVVITNLYRPPPAAP